MDGTTLFTFHGHTSNMQNMRHPYHQYLVKCDPRAYNTCHPLHN